MVKRLTITVQGNWTCNDGRSWIARRKTESHIVVRPIDQSTWAGLQAAIDMPPPIFQSPRTYGPAPCPPVEIVLAAAIGFAAPHLTNQRDYARAAREFIRQNIDRIPYESPDH